MSALQRYVVMVPGIKGEVHVYADCREAAMRAGAAELGLRQLPEGSCAVPVQNDLQKWCAA